MKKIFSSIIFSVFLLSLPASAVLAQVLNPDAISGMQNQVDGGDGANGLISTSGFAANATVGGVLAQVIKAFLGLLGIIFIFLIVIGGYNWMTAAGEEEKVTKAKNTFMRAVIGLIIIVAAYAITYFVFTNLGGEGGGEIPGPPTGG